MHGAAVRSFRRARSRPALVALWLGAVLGLAPASAAVAEAALPTLAVLDFDLLDDQRELAPDTTLGPRLAAIRIRLAEALEREGLYAVVDNGPARALIDASRATQDLHACNGCELAIARSLGVDRVLVGWVQKVSNLILNINLQIEDTATGRVLLNKSVDLRGNTDESWRRGIDYLVRDMVEKHQGGTR